MTKDCIHDNPNNFCREYWRDGKVISHVSSEALAQMPASEVPTRFAWAYNIGPWQPGMTVGDRQAMEPATAE